MAHSNDTSVLKLFISYSRRDAEVADSIVAALETKGFEVKIDRRDLPFGEEWQVELRDFILNCDTVVWLVSPASLESRWVNWELGEVQRANKRLFPVVVAPVEPATLPEALGKLHLLPVEGTFDLHHHLDPLVSALSADRAWIKEHSRLSDRAREWRGEEDRRPGSGRDRLLRGAALRAAETWRQHQPKAAPPPSGLILDLLAASERAAKRRQRWWISGSLAVAIGSMLLAGYAVLQQQLAVENERRANRAEQLTLEQRDAALTRESRLVAGLADKERAAGNFGNAVALARYALPRDLTKPVDRPLTREPLQVLYDAYHSGLETQTVRPKAGRVLGARMLAGGRLLTWGESGAATIWNAAGQEVLRLKGHEGPLREALQLSDGGFVTLGDVDTSARLWSPGGELQKTLYADGYDFTSVTELNDGRLLTSDSGRVVRIWGRNGVQEQAFQREGGSFGGHQLKSGELLVWSGDGIVSKIAPDGTVTALFRGHEGRVHGAIELPEDRILSYGWDRTARIWRQGGDGAGDEIAVLGPHDDEVVSARALSGGRILTMTMAGTARLWSAEGREISQLRNQEGAVAVAEALELGEGRFLTWDSGNEAIRIWSADGEPIEQIRGHRGGVTGVRIMSDGRLLSWGRDNVLRLWTIDGNTLAQFVGHEGVVGGALELGGNRIMSWGWDGTLRFWRAGGTKNALAQVGVHGALELASGRLLLWGAETTLRQPDGTLIATLRAHDGEVRGALELSEGRVLTWGRDRTARIWSEEGHAQAVLDGAFDEIRGAFELPDGRIATWSPNEVVQVKATQAQQRSSPVAALFAQVIAGPRYLPGVVRIWSATGELERKLDGAGGALSDARHLGKGRILTLNDLGRAIVWSSDGTPDFRLEINGASLPGVLPLASGQYLTWGFFEEHALWSATGKRIKTLVEHPGEGMGRKRGAIQLSGGRLLTWSSTTAARLRAPDGASRAVLGLHPRGLEGVVELASGSFLTWDDANTTVLWNADGTKGVPLDQGEYGVKGAVALEDGRLLTWGVDSPAWIRSADGRKLASLGPAEGALQLSDGRLLTWSATGAKLWPPDDAALVAYADRVVAALEPLTAAERCAFFLVASRDGC